MAERLGEAFICDLCGEKWSMAYRNRLFADIRTPEVRDVCGQCYGEIQTAWQKGKRVTDGLLAHLTRRAIRHMRLFRRKPSAR